MRGPSPRGDKLGPLGDKVLFENEFVRIWSVTLDPGERQAWHQHHLPYIIVPMTEGKNIMYFEDGRVAFRDQRMKLPGKALLTGFAVKKFSVTYHAALSYPATVDVGTVVTRVGRSSFELGQGVFDGERCIATAEVLQIYFDPETGRAAPLPDMVRAALEGALAKG